MISYIKLKNFKSFPEIFLDLRGKNGKPKKLAFIYGENGSGKTQLVESMRFFEQSYLTLRNMETVSKILKAQKAEVRLLENDEESGVLLNNILKSIFPNVEKLYSEYRTRGFSEGIELELGFCINEKEGKYILTLDDKGVLRESFVSTLNNKSGVVFSLSRNDKPFISPSVFLNKQYYRQLLFDIKKLWGNHSFLAILMSNKSVLNKEFINDSISSKFLNVLNWMNDISIHIKNYSGEFHTYSFPIELFENLSKGELPDEGSKKIDFFEGILNSLFTETYADIKRVYYKRTKKDEKHRYELYFKKQIGEKIVDIPFSNESMGTRKLLDIFSFILISLYQNGRTVLIDEIDTGIHDLLMATLIKAVIEVIEEYENAQIIATTHNTLLMDALSAKNVYIINSDAYGTKEVACIDSYSKRTQKKHSIRKQYLKDVYGGVPASSDLDLYEIAEIFNTQFQKSKGGMESEN